MSNFSDELIKDAFGSHLNIQIESIGNGAALGAMTALPEHLNRDGRIHGGVLMAFADVVAAHATLLKLPPGARTTTIESKTNFIRSADLVKINAKAVPMHIGRTTMVWQTTVSDESGTTLAIVMQTQLVLQGEQVTAAVKPSGAALEQIEFVDTKPALATDTAEHATQSATPTADRRKAQILSAAFRVISDKGFANAAMREIALEAGMPVPTMYQYVRSKDELLAAIFDDYIGKVKVSVQQSSERSTSPTQKLRAAIEATFTEFDRYQSQIRLMNRETRSVETAMRDRIKQHMLNYIQLYRDIIQEGVTAGEFRPVNVDVYANFIPMLCELWPLRIWSVGRYGATTVRECIVDIALHALTHPRP
jgi:1,4-dihydroxy-2-naphthoyl-CoA hydrolase